MSVDWSHFRNGDKVRVVFEGTWEGDGIRLHFGHLGWLAVDGTVRSATSAELIERPFTPPPTGKMFRSWHGVLFISLGDEGYRMVRNSSGSYVRDSAQFPWTGTDPKWLAALEVLDI